MVWTKRTGLHVCVFIPACSCVPVGTGGRCWISRMERGNHWGHKDSESGRGEVFVITVSSGFRTCIQCAVLQQANPTGPQFSRRQNRDPNSIYIMGAYLGFPNWASCSRLCSKLTGVLRNVAASQGKEGHLCEWPLPGCLGKTTA